MARQILVIGAGISGLATAVALQRHGPNVTVIEERFDISVPEEDLEGVLTVGQAVDLVLSKVGAEA